MKRKIIAVIAILIGFIPGLHAGQSELLAAYGKLEGHINGTSTLTIDGINEQRSIINSNSSFVGSNATTIQASLDLVETYETVEAPLFSTGDFVRGDTSTQFKAARWAIALVYQRVMDQVYTASNLENHRALLDGYKFKSADTFPGKVDPPANPNAIYSVQINASQPVASGYEVQFQLEAARRPTGAYLAPGTIATVTVPAKLVGKGYQIRVGAHVADLSNRPNNLKRLNRVTRTYPINSNSTEIASPLGGGIYIEVPYGIEEGLATIQFKNTVRSPFYSNSSARQTTLSQWQSSERNHLGPWTDFETDKFMLTLPTDWVYNYADPVSLMNEWDKAMDILSRLQGLPLVRPKTVIYAIIDVTLDSNVFSPGYPQSNDSFDPRAVSNGNQSHNLLNGPLTVPDIFWHEFGHAASITKFPGEVESAVNLFHVAIHHQMGEVSIDEAFKGSRTARNGHNVDRDIAAISWATHARFRNGDDMLTNQKSYQHRGHAHYVDNAAMFGWASLENFWKSVADDYDNGIFYPKNFDPTDSRIIRMSRTAGANLAPLIHFWGEHPINANNITSTLESEGITHSAAIYDRLKHYQSIIPMNPEEFQAYHNSIWNIQSSADNNDNLAWRTTWNAALGQQSRDEIQNIIDTYFPNGRPTASLPDATVFSSLSNSGSASTIRNTSGKAINFVVPSGSDQTLENLSLRLGTINSGAVPVISIWSAEGGSTPILTQLETLTNPTTLAPNSVNVFTSTGLTLEAGRTYWIVAGGANANSWKWDGSTSAASTGTNAARIWGGGTPSSWSSSSGVLNAASVSVTGSDFSSITNSGSGSTISNGSGKAIGFAMAAGSNRSLDRVELRLGAVNAGAVPVISIWSAEGGSTPILTRLETLSNPSSISANSVNTFTSSGLTLEAGRTYWIVGEATNSNSWKWDGSSASASVGTNTARLWGAGSPSSWGNASSVLNAAQVFTQIVSQNNVNGVPTSWLASFGLDLTVAATLADTDGDGLNNMEEYLAGKNPLVSDNPPGLRVTEYYLTTGDFTGTTANVTLNQNLAPDYFVLVRGSRDGNGLSMPDSDYARVTAVPSGTSEMANSGSANRITLARSAADQDWEGVVTVVECLNPSSTGGFKMLDILSTNLNGASGADSSAAWSDIDQVTLFGGYRGGGANFVGTPSNRSHGTSLYTRIYPTGNNTLNWKRDAGGETLFNAVMTTFVIEWGSEWNVQRVNVAGASGGNGANATGEYITSSINSVNRGNTWVWGTGTRFDAGIGDSAEASLVTLGNGVTQNTTENRVAVGSEYTDGSDFDVYVMTHTDLAVDHRFKADGNSGVTDLAVTVDSAPSGARFGWVYNGVNGTGDYFPRPRMWSRYTANGQVTISRGFSGQNFPAWVQGIDFSGLNN